MSFPENSLAYQHGSNDALNPNILKTIIVGSHMLGTKQLDGEGWIGCAFSCILQCFFVHLFLFLAIGEFLKNIGVSEVHLHKAKKAL